VALTNSCPKFSQLLRLLLFAASLPAALTAQSDTARQCGKPTAKLLGAQTTFIGQSLPPFSAAYSGPMSLRANGDHQLSQSYGLYGGACLVPNVAAYVDGEMIRGSGISHASGLAGVTNGDVLRQGSVDLGDGPYVARAFLRWTIPLRSKDVDTVARGVDALPGVVSARRVEVTAGKFAATDVFDLNRYANSTRTQFLDWVLFNDGAWDYAADTRGYSNGVVVAWITPAVSLRVGSLQMPTFANGNRFDDDIANARGDNVEVTFAAPRDAVIRVLAYENHGRMGDYDLATAIAHETGTIPNIVATDSPGRTKYGAALNAELPIADDGETGVFARAGWNDGRHESFVFTEVDRHLSAGGQVSGRHWHRPNDAFAIAGVVDGLSAPHRNYLAAGGSGFLLGDGALRYSPESIAETYYLFAIARDVAISPDVMFIANPGYNRARGPATVLTTRLNAHW
jgi:high affinity Mn2+ porin